MDNKWKKTGSVRIKRGWFGRQKFQFEECRYVHAMNVDGFDVESRWCDVRNSAEDLLFFLNRIDHVRYKTPQELFSELYQILGALDAPAAVLDQVLAAANGETIPVTSLLPFTPEAVKVEDNKICDCVNGKCNSWYMASDEVGTECRVVYPPKGDISCDSCKGGPQFGHAFDCPTLP